MKQPPEHSVDLLPPSNLPFNSAKFDGHPWTDDRRVTLELREDDYLYLDGQRITLHLVDWQKSDNINGYSLRQIRNEAGNNVPNQVLDYLIEHPELWPKRWEKDQNGNILYVFFWNDIFYSQNDGDLYVRYAYRILDAVHSHYYRLVRRWFSYYPAAVLES